MERYWLSWYQPRPDPRPLTFPPNGAILGWWRTGECPENFVDGAFTLCALVEAETDELAWAAVRVDWPDMAGRRFCDAVGHEYQITSDRFPLSDWMIDRLKGGK